MSREPHVMTVGELIVELLKYSGDQPVKLANPNTHIILSIYPENLDGTGIVWIDIEETLRLKPRCSRCNQKLACNHCCLEAKP
jgi:hypothetical protein